MFCYCVITGNFPQQAKSLSLRKLLDQYCADLMGAFWPAAVCKAVNADALEGMQNVGLHLPEIPENVSTNCAVLL